MVVAEIKVVVMVGEFHALTEESVGSLRPDKAIGSLTNKEWCRLRKYLPIHDNFFHALTRDEWGGMLCRQ